MFDTLKAYFQLIGLFVQYGKITHSGLNFNKNRNDALKDLAEFVPSNFNTLKQTGLKDCLWKNTLIRNLLSQAAYIKNSYKTKSGHLHAPASKLSYIRIPKSANTSVSLEMLKKIYPTLKQKDLSNRQINFLTDSNLQYSGIIAGNDQTYFTAVRNPFSRLVSVYYDFFENRTGEFIYQDYLFGVLRSNISFSQFIERIICIPDALKDQHFKPQHVLLQYYEKQKVQLHIFKLEESERLQTFLKSHKMQLLHINESANRHGYRDYYTPLLVEKVYRHYSADIEKLDYKKAYAELVEYMKNSSI